MSNPPSEPRIDFGAPSHLPYGTIHDLLVNFKIQRFVEGLSIECMNIDEVTQKKCTWKFGYSGPEYLTKVLESCLTHLRSHMHEGFYKAVVSEIPVETKPTYPSHGVDGEGRKIMQLGPDVHLMVDSGIIVWNDRDYRSTDMAMPVEPSELEEKEAAEDSERELLQECMAAEGREQRMQYMRHEALKFAMDVNSDITQLISSQRVEQITEDAEKFLNFLLGES